MLITMPVGRPEWGGHGTPPDNRDANGARDVAGAVSLRAWSRLRSAEGTTRNVAVNMRSFRRTWTGVAGSGFYNRIDCILGAPMI